MSSSPSLAKGSLVWAKLPAFPWWPAKVTDVAGSDVYVTFCGTGDMGTVLRGDAIPYASRPSLREGKQKERWKKKFKQAIEEADLHAGLVEGAAPSTVDAQGDITSHDDAGAEKAKVAEEEETVVLDAKVGGKPTAEDSSEDEGAGPSKGEKKKRKKEVSNKRKLPADPGLPGWYAPPVENAPPRSPNPNVPHTARPVARRPAVAPPWAARDVCRAGRSWSTRAGAGASGKPSTGQTASSPNRALPRSVAMAAAAAVEERWLAAVEERRLAAAAATAAAAAAAAAVAREQPRREQPRLESERQRRSRLTARTRRKRTRTRVPALVLPKRRGEERRLAAAAAAVVAAAARPQLKSLCSS